MAFLDNSGDIILDAVLTDLGRKRMAEGNFSITQFSLGDDEIDYSLYNRDHPSGSAYYDLEILQTPVFEAFTRENSNINYGLATFNGNPELLYLPKVVLNQKRDFNTNTVKLSSGVVYLAVNDETFQSILSGTAGAPFVLNAGASDTYVSFETGIDNNNDPAGGVQDRNNFLVNNNLIDDQFNLSCDKRFLTSIRSIITSDSATIRLPGTPGAGFGGSSFSFPPGGEKEIKVSLKPMPLVATARPGDQRELLNYTLDTIPNLVYDQGSRTQGGGAATDVSEISGPRGVFTALNFNVPADLKTTSAGTRPSKFSLYGRVGLSAGDLPNVGGIGSETYDIIDTIVYLRGNTTGANTQLIVRIIRQATAS